MSPEEAKELAAKYTRLAEFCAAKAAGKELQFVYHQYSSEDTCQKWMEVVK